MSGVSKDSFEEERSVTCTDIKLIMPTVLILLFTLFIMVTLIPYVVVAVLSESNVVDILFRNSVRTILSFLLCLERKLNSQ